MGKKLKLIDDLYYLSDLDYTTSRENIIDRFNQTREIRYG